PGLPSPPLNLKVKNLSKLNYRISWRRPVTTGRTTKTPTSSIGTQITDTKYRVVWAPRVDEPVSKEMYNDQAGFSPIMDLQKSDARIVGKNQTWLDLHDLKEDTFYIVRVQTLIIMENEDHERESSPATLYFITPKIHEANGKLGTVDLNTDLISFDIPVEKLKNIFLRDFRKTGCNVKQGYTHPPEHLLSAETSSPNYRGAGESWAHPQFISGQSSIMKVGELSEKEVAEIMKGFRMFDPKNTGYIEDRQLGNALRWLKLIPSEAQIQSFLEVLDPKKSGWISMELFLVAAAELCSLFASAVAATLGCRKWMLSESRHDTDKSVGPEVIEDV
ncbi:hypothetical protein PHET_08233, partial [Paragonimus heterotremus]